jgi:hypothetical protein
MPRHLLGRPDLDLADAESWPLGVKRTPLDLIQLAGIFDWFHGILHLTTRTRALWVNF